VLVDLPCTSKLNIESRVIKPLAVGLLDWKLLSPARVTFWCQKWDSNHDQSQLKFRSDRFVLV